MKIIAPIALSVAVLAGCGTSTGIVKITDDTYMLAKQDSVTWSGASVKVEIYKEANQYCASQGKKFVAVSDKSVDAAMYQSMAGAEIQFKCQ